MRTRFLLALAALALQAEAAAPSNSITISNLSDTEAASNPFSVSRVFAAGDIGAYPHPRVAGEPLSLWQADVKSRWPDGSARHVMISFAYTIPARSSVTVDFVDDVNPCSAGDRAACDAAALDQAGMLAFHGGNWSAAIEAAAGSSQSASARQMITDGNFRYWLRGPVVTQVIAEDRTTTRTYDFGWTCATGCAIANMPLSAATVNVAQRSFTVPNSFANGEAVFLAGNNTPLQNYHKFYVVNATADSFQLSSTANGGPEYFGSTGSGPMSIVPWDYAGTTWSTDSTGRLLHPLFVLSFYRGWDGVKVEYTLENTWAGLAGGGADQRYDLTLRAGVAGTARYTLPGLTHYGGTRWRKIYWDGAQPTYWNGDKPATSMKFDLNFPYLVYSKAIPQYDLRYMPDSGDVAYDTTFFNARVTPGIEPVACSGVTTGYCGSWLMAFPTTGGRPDIGLFPRWYVRYLYTFDPAGLPALYMSGDISGLVPTHVREALPDRYFDSGHTVNAFGRWISADARPTVSFIAGATAQDTLSPANAAPGSAGHGWNPDRAHEPNMAYVPWLVTGDYWYLEEIQSWAASDLIASDSNSYTHYGHHADWAVMIEQQTRGQAWALRSIFEAAFASPDGSPEKAYFQEKILNTIAAKEGEFNVTDGIGYPAEGCNWDTYDPRTTTSKWCFGRGTIGWNLSNALAGQNMGVPPVSAYVKGNGTVNVANVTQQWEMNFYHVVLGHAEDLGFPVRAWRRGLSKNLIGEILDPALNPFFLDLSNSYPITYYPPDTRSLTQAVGAGDLTLHMSDDKPSWVSLPMVLYLSDNGAHIELVRLCSWSGKVATLCGNGRGIESSAQPHPVGSTIGQLVYFPNWAAVRTGYSTDPNTYPTGYTGSTWTTATDTDHGYAIIARAAAQFMDGLTVDGMSGTDAATFMRTSVAADAVLAHNPKWAIVPRRDPTRATLQASGDTEALLSYVTPRAADICSVTLAATADYSRPVVSGADTPGLRSRTKSFTGLTPGATYFWRVNCPSDPYNGGNTDGWFNTSAAGGTVSTLPISVKPPAGGRRMNVATAIVEYGDTDRLGNVSAPVACAGGCLVTVPGWKGKIVHYRIKYRDAGGKVVATGTVESAIPR